MRLDAWLKREERSNAWLARQIGVSRSAVYQWTTGGALPSAYHIAQIQHLTRYEVTASDFATVDREAADA